MADDPIKEIESAEKPLEEAKAELDLLEKINKIKKEIYEQTELESELQEKSLALLRQKAEKEEAMKLAKQFQQEMNAAQADGDVRAVALLKDQLDSQLAVIKATEEEIKKKQELYNKTKKVKDLEDKRADAAEDLGENLFNRTLGLFAAEMPETAIGGFLQNPGKFIGGFAGKAKMLKDPLAILVAVVDNVVQKTFELAEAQDRTIVRFRQATNTSGELDDNIVALERSFYAAGVSTDEAGEAIQSLFINVNDFNVMSEEQQKTLGETVAILNELGVKSDTVAQNLQFATKVMGMSTSQAEGLQRELFDLARGLGLSADQVASDFKKFGPQLAALGAQGVDAFRELETQAKSTGIAIDDLVSIASKFDTFDSAAQSVGRLNALLGGPFLNSLELVNQTNPAKRIELLKDAIDRAGVSFDNMDYYQRKALASAMGIDEMQLALLSRGKLDLIAEPTKSAAELEELAILTREYNTLMDDLSNILMALAVNIRPVIDAFKDFLAFIDPLLPILEGVGKFFIYLIVAGNALLAAVPVAVFYLLVKALEFVEKHLGITAETMATVLEIIGYLAAGILLVAGVITLAPFELVAAEIAAIGAAIAGVVYFVGELIKYFMGLSSVFYHKSASPGFITMLYLVQTAFEGVNSVISTIGTAIEGIADSIINLAVAIKELLSVGTANALGAMAVGMKDMVGAINEVQIEKAVTVGGVIAAVGAVSVAGAAVAEVGQTARAVINNAMGGGETPAPATAAAGVSNVPAPTFNINLSIDGKEFSTAVNSVEVSNYNEAVASVMYKSIQSMIDQGLVKG